MKETVGEKVFNVFNIIILSLLSASFLYPFWNTFVLSFNDSLDSLRGGVYFWPRIFTLDNYQAVLSDSTIYRAYVITILKTVFGTLTSVTFTGMFAYGLSKKKLMFRNFYLTICTITLFFSGGLIPTYLLYRSLGLLDNFMVYIIPGLWSVGNMLVMKSFFDGISSSLIEAAWIDGANNAKIFFKIIIPLSTPVFIVVGMFTFNSQIGNFFWPYLLISSKEKTVLGVQLYKMKSSTYTMDYQMLALLFSVIPQIIIFAIFQKQIMGGINIGGVKG